MTLNFLPRRCMAALMALAALAPSYAQDFFCTDDAEELLSFGVRAGLNTSNTSVTDKAIRGYNVNSWGTGIDLGFVTDLNFKDYLTVQPGLFFESRSNNYAYTHPVALEEGAEYLVQLGHMRTYRLQVPVVCSIRLNVTDDIRLSGDAGPYVAFNIGSHRDNKSLIVTDEQALAAKPFDQRPRTTEFGFKVGAGIQVLQHYYFGIHYCGAFTGAWKDNVYENIKTTYGGHNKAWTFTLGYDF